MAIGGSGKMSSASRNRLDSKRLRQKKLARHMLLETLENRQLMAAGPQLLGVQPNAGSLLENGQVLQIAPRELLFRFDDANGISASSLNGIRIIRSGEDGAFDRASMATDLGSTGQVMVEFYAQEPGSVGNGIEIRFTQRSRGDSRLPVVTVSGTVVNVELNSNPGLETRAEDLLQVFDPAQQTSATRLVYALRLRGSTLTPIGRTVDISKPVVLSGANSSKVSTSFGLDPSVQVRLTSRDSGGAGIGITVNVTARDRGGPGSPIVGVNGKTINVELNSNSRFPTTVQEFVDALNASDSQSSALVEARLTSGSPVTRIGNVATSYSPLILTGVSDLEVVPAYVGLGDTNREVVMRFAETLPDDKYRIEIIGRGSRALRNVAGQVFNGGIDRAIDFELDLGAQIESIVPQPVIRNANGQWVHHRNRIDIYFNDDDLIDVSSIATVNGLTMAQIKAQRVPFFLQNTDVVTFVTGASGQRSAIDPNFYQLFHSANTLDNADDTRVLPNAVQYFPDSDRVVLTFNRNLDQLVNPNNNNALPPAELRLRVGTNEAKPLPPISMTPAADPADTFSGALNLAGSWTPGGAGSQSILINSEIRNTTPLALDFPGGSDEPGNRRIRMQDNLLGTADSVDGTSVIFYNFQGQLGTFSNTVLLNAITEQQKQRVREIFTLYERYLGVRFVESDNLGLTVAVGDTRSVIPFPLVANDFRTSVITFNQQGGTTFESGTLISSGQLATVMDIQDFGDAGVNNFGGPFMRAAMQGIGQLLGLGTADEVAQLTIQSFNAVFAPGVGTEIVLPGDADIVHGQYLYRPDSKDIDLYQFSLPTSGHISIEAFAERMSQASLLDSHIRLYRQNANGGWDEIATNDDYYSSDSFVELELSQGNYIVGVSASGNRQYDPTISDSGIGGRSQGNYQLRMDFRPPAAAVLRDGTGTAVDGDADGQAGGVHNFWFRPSGPANTKFVDKSVATSGNGLLASPFKTISAALTSAQPGDVVRILGNGGADGRVATPADNLPYEIGFDTIGRPLSDGATFDVPRDVSVMIDAGAILKMRRSRVGVGSTSVNVDRSAGSLMVLGTPHLLDASGAIVTDSAGVPVAGKVIFTALGDQTAGKNFSPATSDPSPKSGDWGGLDYRNRIDNQSPGRKNFERQGIFLNYVAHADLRYGGGQVVVDGVSQPVTPVYMVDSRPTVGFTEITHSADAAMSATPNSFLENNFHSPAEQVGASFTIDYDRVGPDLYRNRLTGNSINGLQIRTSTLGGSQLEAMTVQGRFDDIDVVHIVPENLEVRGTVGGALIERPAPTATLVNVVAQTGGTLLPGVYNYRMTFIDANGVEGPASEPTASVSILTTNSSVVISNLPQGVRRIYRSTDTGAGPYVLIRELNGTATSMIDDGSSLGTQLSSAAPSVRARLDARLAIDAGAVVKLQGSRIELTLGAQLLAEGTADAPIVFTSINDNRYGAGGTFDTANRSGSQVAAPGDWGGIYVGHTSSASLDHVVVAFGGGTTRVDGGFADFNAIEAHQADMRIANSRIEKNNDGVGTASNSERGGRQSNANGTIFVRNSQPIIVNNIIADNVGHAISANVNALNQALVSDYGRSTGAIDRFTIGQGNRGPLVSDNRLSNNDINGMVVRGGNLTTEGTWDDTDIVHVVLSEIIVSDHQHYGGLRLMSDGTESLVVKLSGNVAGITATGQPLDNANRIGGSVQMVGAPGYPVVLTSLADCTVGAGFTLNGQAQNDTDNTGACVAAPPQFADIVVVMDESGSMGGAQQFAAGMIPQLDTALLRAGIGASAAGANRFGLVGFGDSNDVARSIPLGASGALFGTSTEYVTASALLTTSGVIEDGYDGIDLVLNSYQFRQDAQKFIILVTDEDRDIIDPSLTFGSVLAGLQARDVKLEGILGTTIVDQNLRQALAIDRSNRVFTANGTGGFTVSANGRITASSGTTQTDYIDMAFETSGIVGDIRQIAQGGTTAQSFGNALVSSIVVQAGGLLAAPGDWRSTRLDTLSNDRNVAIVNEFESAVSTAGANNTPQFGQFLGEIAPNTKSGDENRRLGFQIDGVLSAPNDLDVYSFRANAGTEVWLDIDRTLNSLDTVVELIDANGRTLALSDNSLAEEADPNKLVSAVDLPAGSIHSLRKSPAELYFRSAQGAPKDLYSTNPRDAGLRVVLPGEAGANNLYHIRVRSSNLRSGDAASKLLDPAQLNNGLTSGSYQLQVRLQEVDEIPGSSVTFADIRYASNGLDLNGVPRSSPLLGENRELNEPFGSPQVNDTPLTAQRLGNLLQTDRGAISVAGELNAFTNTDIWADDVDWYQFDIDYQAVSFTGLREYFSTVFDIDYADGIGRPDTSLYVWDTDVAGNPRNLILVGLSSNRVDDQAGATRGADNADLSRGSAGNLDPMIGPIELPVGRYFVAVTNSDRTPQILATFNDPNSTAANIRMQPIESTRYIAEDHVDYQQGGFTATPPITPVLFPRPFSFDSTTGSFYDTSNDSIVDFDLNDVPLYVTQDAGLEETNLFIANAFTGGVANQVGRINFDIQDIAFRANGQLRAYDRSLERRAAANDQDSEIDYINIETTSAGSAAAQAATIGTTGINTFHIEVTPGAPPTIAAVDSNDGVHVEAITFGDIGEERGFFVGSRPIPPDQITPDQNYPTTFSRQNVGTSRQGPSYFANIIYEFNENTGAAISAPAQDKQNIPQALGAGTQIVERGYIETRPPAGTRPSILAAKEATTGQLNGSPILNIRDGDIFTLRDNSNFAVRFEFNFGPEVLVNYDPSQGRFVRDGMRFTLDGKTYEFDTGSVLVVNALNGQQLADGATVRVTNSGGVQRVFEFDSNNSLSNSSNVAVRFSNTSTRTELMNSLVSTINGQVGFGVQASVNANSDRVTFTGVSNTLAVAVTGNGLSVQGAPGVGAGNTPIRIEETSTLKELISAISTNVGPGITTSFDSGRLSFSGATVGSFVDLAASGIFADLGSSGATGVGTIPIRVLANDSAATVAEKVAQAINSAGIPGLSATVTGVEVTLVGGGVDSTVDPFTGATVFLDGPLTAAGNGAAPGGIIKGAAMIGFTMYAVSDRGGLYSVQFPNIPSSGNVGTYITSSYDLSGIQFTALTAAPRHLATNGNINYADLLIGIDVNGDMYAFDTQGRLQPAFANGQSRISTGVFNANGLAFSTLDYNLWHVSTRRSGELGHGEERTGNVAGESLRNSIAGGSSLYFGFESPANNSASVPGGLGDISGRLDPGNRNDYNFPGGAAGAIESQPFDLSGLSGADLPTLYFNYRFETEQASSILPLGTDQQDYMRDSLRVYASGEDGNWILMATNNSLSTNNNAFNDEFDSPLVENEKVQQLFDNNGQWRQARISLADFSGQRNVKLRIEFSSAGGFGYGMQGGRGAELRVIPGDRLVDGQTMTVHGQTFEIEMGATVVMPSGASIRNGDSLTVDGVTYVFTDGSGPAPGAPAIAVSYLSTDTAEQIAAKLRTAMLTASQVAPIVSGLNFSLESNDTTTTASSSGIVGDSIILNGTGTIGDNGSLPIAGQDVDLVRMELDVGATVTVSALASAGSTLDSFLRVFDADGAPLTNQFGFPIQNDNFQGSNNAQVTFTAPYSGIYFVGVSGAGNSNYSAVVTGRATTGSTGPYDLNIRVARNLNPIHNGSRLQLEGARNVSVPVGSPILVQGQVGTTGNPIVTNIGMTTPQVAAAVQQSLANVFANGATNAYRIRSGDTIDLTGLVVYDSFDFFTGQRTPSATELSPGPFGATRTFIGDVFGAFNTSSNPNGTLTNGNPGALRTSANTFDGVFLDDFIIGVAGRGEIIVDQNRLGPNNPVHGNTTFIDNPQPRQNNPILRNEEVLVGPYQLEIRGGEEYGVPLLDDAGRVTFAINDTLVPSDRLARGIAVQFNSAAQFIPRQTFTISDGTRLLTFELDDVNDGVAVTPGNIAVPYSTSTLDPATGNRASDSAKTIAARIRDLINSPALQARFQVSANLLNADRAGATSDTLVLIGQANVNIPSNIGRVIVSNKRGDSNREREQGQVVVQSSRISHSSGFGVVIQPAPRDPITNAPNPGSPRNTVTLNSERLMTSAVVMNNELMFNQSGGISVSGDPVTANVPQAPVPFARLVNNTIVGGTVNAVTTFTATIHGGQLFPIGNLAFADAVADYAPLAGAGPAPLVGLDLPTEAIGTPNYTSSIEPGVNQGVVSLGRGGQLVVQFVDNLLVGSGDATPDLMIFEVGDSEEVLVEVSADGSRYRAVGRASAASPKIDIDAFGFNQNSRLAFVRLTDVINQGAVTGDSVGADIDAVAAISSVPVDRFIAGGEGIRVTNNASATLLNNVLVNSTIGVNIDASSSSTVVGGTLFHRNAANTGGVATTGQFSNIVGDNVPVFVSVGTGNLYPSPASPVIDSSIDSLEDRLSLVAVKQSLGMDASPIKSPQYDVNGQLRVDDPSVETPSGLGENIFKDRGAQDRADFVGPSVVLMQPADNDLAGKDGNALPAIVELTRTTLKFFDIQLVDGLEPSEPSRGANVDDSTVRSSAVLVYRDNEPLVEGRDYTFGYDATNGIIRLTPLSGIWKSESVYTVRFLNSREAAVIAKAPTGYLDGEMFDIADASGSLTTFEFDLGYLIQVPTLNGVDANVSEGGTFTLDNGARRLTFEFDLDGSVAAGNLRVPLTPTPTPDSVAQQIASAINAAGLQVTASQHASGIVQLQGGNLVTLEVNNSGLTATGKPGVRTVFGLQIPLQAGFPNGITDGQTFSIDRSGSPVTFELDTNGVVVPGNVPVRFADGASANQIGVAMVSAIAGSGLGLSPEYVGGGLVKLGGDRNTRVDVTNTVLRPSGTAGLPAAIAIPISIASSNSADNIAAQIKAAIENARLAGVSVTLFGTRIVIEGSQGVAGTGAGQIQAIRDLAGNPLKANQVNGTTSVTIFLGEGLDYGDAPTPYTSAQDANGPRHTVVNGFSLGTTVSPDADAKLPNADDDDGIVFTTNIVAAFQTNLQVSVTKPSGTNAFLSGWIDYNRNGTFDVGERVASSLPITQAVTTLSLLVPSSASLGSTYARFRLSSDVASVNTPVGPSPDGEVEDHLITILGNPFKNPSNGLDVNGDGSVSPIDVLQVINYINDPSKPKNLSLPVNQPLPPYIDVNGDGFVSAIDALLVITHLNNLPPRGGAEGEGESPSSDLAIMESSQVVMSSDWHLGLDSLLMPRPAKLSASRQDASAVASSERVAILESLESETMPIQVGQTVSNTIDLALVELDDVPEVLAQDVRLEYLWLDERDSFDPLA